jgi:Holliday junction resolvasome RuvABC endonuclease subunit
MNDFRVHGIDLSLTSTGVAMLTCRGGIFTWWTARYESKGKRADTLDQRAARLRQMAASITTTAGSSDLVVIEAPSFGSGVNAGSMHDRSGLWWSVVQRLIRSGAQVVEVPPTCRAKYATGKGNAAKDAVMLAAAKRYPDAGITGNDIADSVILAAMGARRLGVPVEASLPVLNLAGMDGVRWPELLSDEAVPA